MLAKWLGRQPALLIVDEPTRGIDIATKAEVHRLLVRLARDGVAILMISSELPEVLHVGDRILVMREGRLTAEFGHDGRLGGEDHGRRDRPAAGGRHDDHRDRAPGARRAPRPGSGSRRLTERVFRIRESGIIAVLLVFVAVTTSIQPSFLNQQNIQFLLINTTVYALLALGETMVVVSRNVDLSIGSVLGLSAYVSAGMFGHHPGIPIPVVFLVGLGIGLACGMANGLMVAIGRVPSLVVTLATLYIIRGIDILIVGGNEVVAQTPAERLHQHPPGHRARRALPGHRDRRGDRDRRVLPARRSGPAASCTRSARTRRRPGWPASRSAGGSSPRSR